MEQVHEEIDEIVVTPVTAKNRRIRVDLSQERLVPSTAQVEENGRSAQRHPRGFNPAILT